jgi:tetratricopeptide (TPR) repeat protein
MLMALLCAGCASSGEDPEPHIAFTKATINAKPAILLLDTGASLTTLDAAAADRYGISVVHTPPEKTAAPYVPLDTSEPAQLDWSGQTYAVPFAIFQEPWLLRLLPMEIPGVVAWSAIRDNILFFDTDHHVVRRLPQLLADVGQWIRFPIKDDRGVLAFALPKADGSAGIVYIDTGAPIGLALPDAEWDLWMRSHPHTPEYSAPVYGPSAGLIAGEEVWVDRYDLGPLSLTDIPVFKDHGIYSTTAPNFAGCLGMYGLERVDLIVDAPGGFVYLKPRPPPGPYYSNFKRAGVATPKNPAAAALWTVDASVHLDFTRQFMELAGLREHQHDLKAAIHAYTLLLQADPSNVQARCKRGQDYLKAGAFTDALADFDQVIAQDPGQPDALFYRAWVRWNRHDPSGALADFDACIAHDPHQAPAYFGRGLCEAGLDDQAKAVADFDAALKIDPALAAAYYNRAVSKQKTGDFAGAASDYEKYLALHPKEPDYPRLYLQVVRLRLGVAAPPASPPVWGDNWTKSVAQYLAGNLDERALLTLAGQASRESVEGQRCEAYYFIAEVCLAHGNVTEARDYFQKCLATNQDQFYEYEFARAELANLDTPNRPPQ